MILRKICVVTATRAEYGLLYWLLRELQSDPEIDLQLVVTGAHLSQSFGMTVKLIEADGFTINERISMLLADDTPQGVSKSLGLAVLGFADLFARQRPDVLLLIGDRYEMLAAAQSALIAQIPIAHVHGGETTEGAIDEAIRHSITKMSYLHFVAAEPYRQRVIQLGESGERVWTVGATAMDNIDKLPLVDRAEIEHILSIKLKPPSVLVTYQPVTLSSEEPAAPLRRLLEVLDDMAGSIVFTGVNADTFGNAIRKEVQTFVSEHSGRAYYFESLGSLRYLSLMKSADVVMGNSSSGLLEAPAIGTPSVDIGERQQGRLAAPSVIRSDTSVAAMREALKKALSKDHRELAARRDSPFGKPGVAKRIAAILRDYPLDNVLIKRFQDIPVKA